MRLNRYKELLNDNEITMLRDDIKEDFNGFPHITKTTAKYILKFNQITLEDTFAVDL